MKRLFLLFTLAFVAMSCEMIDEKLDDLLDKRDWVVFAEGTELTVNVPSKQTVLNYKFESTLDWEVKTGDEWLEIDPTSGKAGKDIKIQIKVAKNKEKTSRTGYADLTLSNDESYRITINQAGEGDENEDVVVDIPNNQIWYTSIDGKIVEPYSGEYNEYAEAITTFGGNILSNTYADGKGVIEFDAPITMIGDYAFLYCNTITTLSFAKSVTTIGDCAFYGCSSLTSVTIPDSVTAIGYAAFAYCDSLTSVTIPDSVTSIGGWVFFSCSSLTSVTIPYSVTTIGFQAFSWCESLTSVTIPDSVTSIGGYAFSSCYSLTSITIPDSVTTIGDSAFGDCSSLTSVTIPYSVTEIGDAAFGDCNSLQEFNGKFASDNGRCLIIDGTLNSFAPAGLAEYTIPDSVTTIGRSAFCDCRSLTSVTIPDSVTTIGNQAFLSCYSLTSITIPDSVTTIGEWAFSSCYSLTSITIPYSVTTIGEGVFADCSSLTSVYCKPATPPTTEVYDNYWYAFVSNAYNRIIYVPTESVDVYKTATGWSDYADAIVGYNF